MSSKSYIHLWHYLILTLILATGVVAFFVVGAQPERKFLIGVLIITGYMLWGIFHHLTLGDLNRKRVVEYSVLSLCALSILWAFLYL